MGKSNDPYDLASNGFEQGEPDYCEWAEFDDGLETEPEPGDFDVEPEWDDT